MKRKPPSRTAPPIDFDLRQLEIFRKVVDLGSFSRAADAVHLAQASVSERIATLESMVGVKLLDRLGRKVVPTKAGELLHKHAVLLLEMKHTALLEMQGFLGIKEGEIRMGGSTIPGEYILPRMIGRFREQYPLVCVSLVIGDSSKIESSVLEGELELGIVGSKSLQKSLLTHELWKDQLVLAVPAGHRWAKRNEVSLQELAEEPFISREAGSGTFRIVDAYLRTAKSSLETVQPVARLGSSTAVKEGIKAGLGLSILSARALDTELKTGVLNALKIKDMDMSRSFYLIRDRRRIASPLCGAMVEFLNGTSED